MPDKQDLTSLVLQVLRNGRRQTSRSILAELGSLGVECDQGRVRRALRELQLNDDVEKVGAAWRAKTILPPCTQPISAVQPPESFALGTTRPIKSKSAAKRNVTTGQTFDGRWATFRRLCAYYMDCIFLEERPNITAYKDRKNDTWIQIKKQLLWASIRNGKPFSLLLDGEEVGIQKTRTKQGMDMSLFIGYPIIKAKAKGQDFFVPIFVQAFDVDGDMSALTLSPAGPLMLNTAWLKYQFGNYEEQNNFLQLLGLVPAQVDDDWSSPENDIAKLAVDVGSYFHDKVKESILPQALNFEDVARIKQPGIYNRALLITGSRLIYTRSLLRELRNIASWKDEDLDKTALAHVFPHEPPSEGLFSEKDDVPKEESYQLSNHDTVELKTLNNAQRQAVKHSLSEPVSVITGPPGSGKSEVVRSILVNHAVRGQPAIFASKNHQALDAVEPVLNQTVNSGNVIVRAASRDLAQRNDWKINLKDILARPQVDNTSARDFSMHQLCDAIENIKVSIDKLEQYIDSEKQYAELNHEIQTRLKKLPVQLKSSTDYHPGDVEQLRTDLDILTRDTESFLEKIKRMLFKRQYLARAERVHNELMRMPSPTEGLPEIAGKERDKWQEILEQLELLVEFREFESRLANEESILKELPSCESMNRDLEQWSKQARQYALDALSAVASGQGINLSPTERERLANIRSAVANLGDVRFQRMFAENFPLILKTFPLWAVSNLSVRSALPLIPGVFEQIIIDEASQCDIASVIPLLARSRTACVVGDPRQLSHVCNIPKALERNLLEAHMLTDISIQRFTYKENSCFDLVNNSGNTEARTLLTNHYRCHPEIAEFSNEAFYQRALDVVTVTEKLKVPKDQSPGLYWSNIEGEIAKAPTGATSEAEAAFILDQIKNLDSDDYDGTIGIVTPFKHQANLLHDKVYAEVSRKFRLQSQLQIGTAHAFQGSERDLMYFSLCCGPEMPKGADGFIAKEPNLFNVAVTRAKAILHIVGNKKWADSCHIPFVRSCAKFCDREVKVPDLSEEVYESPWEKVLSEALIEAEVDVIPQYPIAGRRLDLAVLSPVKLDIEVDGEKYHRTGSGARKDDDHYRDLQMESLGWKVIRFWVYEIRDDLQGCIDKVKRLAKSDVG